jgi:hypothetical protein
MQTLNAFFAAISAFFKNAAARITESSAETDRRELEAFLSDASSIYELEARERQWAARKQYRNGFQA